MKLEKLREEIGIELDSIDITVRELVSLRRDIGDKEPTIREKTAAASFLAQFYNGIENILKRINAFHGHRLKAGNTWHLDLFNRFCEPSTGPFPALLDKSLATSLAPYRQFRHVVHHGYGFQFDWARMQEGADQIERVFSRFKMALFNYLQALES
jgi:hypothetical protein